MRAWIPSTTIVLALTFAVGSVHADCATPPAACFCQTAAAVVDGHVEAVLADSVSVRVDSVTESATPSTATPQVGTVVEISGNDFWGTATKLGDRVIAPYDSSGQVIAPARLVLEGRVSCDGGSPIADATDVSNWMVMEAAACQQSVEQELGEYECDDTSSSCAVGDRRAVGWGSLPIAALGAVLLCLRRRKPRLFTFRAG
jgi:hypothetical protein